MEYEKCEYGKLLKEAFDLIEEPYRLIDLPELEKTIRFCSLWLKKRIEEREWEALTLADMAYILKRELNQFKKRFNIK